MRTLPAKAQLYLIATYRPGPALRPPGRRGRRCRPCRPRAGNWPVSGPGRGRLRQEDHPDARDRRQGRRVAVAGLRHHLRRPAALRAAGRRRHRDAGLPVVVPAPAPPARVPARLQRRRRRHLLLAVRAGLPEPERGRAGSAADADDPGRGRRQPDLLRDQHAGDGGGDRPVRRPERFRRLARALPVDRAGLLRRGVYRDAGRPALRRALLAAAAVHHAGRLADVPGVCRVRGPGGGAAAAHRGPGRPVSGHDPEPGPRH